MLGPAVPGQDPLLHTEAMPTMSLPCPLSLMSWQIASPAPPTTTYVLGSFDGIIDIPFLEVKQVCYLVGKRVLARYELDCYCNVLI